MTKQLPQDYISVNEYLDNLNSELSGFDARVIGEITEVQLYEGRSYLFFKIKDKDEEALLTCIMWRRDYDLCGVDLEAGLEVVISGTPDIYKPSGRFSFKTKTVELVGEGQLKKAYDELKLKLGKEGLFDESRKRPLPKLPEKIGIVTSKDGAAIGDFGVNLGRFGLKVSLVDSRVEGQQAVQDLLGAIRTFQNTDIEVLVLIRGGGSLESLLSFNNEALVREVVNFPVPVLVGVGHERDISLVALAADKMVSTPTAAAEALNESWENSLNQMYTNTNLVFSQFGSAINSQKITVQTSFDLMREYFESIFITFDSVQRAFIRAITKTQERAAILQERIPSCVASMTRGMEALIRETSSHISEILENSLRTIEMGVSNANKFVLSTEQIMKAHDPERQLRLGYSIVRLNGKVVRSVHNLKDDEIIETQLNDGLFNSKIINIKK